MSLLPKLRDQIGELGYRPEFFSAGLKIGDGLQSVEFVAHSRLPKDIRTAAIAVLERGEDPQAQADLIRSTGAALVIEVDDQEWICSRVSESGLNQIERGKFSELIRFFKKHRDKLHPDAIYRAKTWGRLDPTVRQLEFVDSGLMPIVEGYLGHNVSQLLEECVQDLSTSLGWKKLADTPASRTKAQWLIKAPFWLLAAKTLRDKQVPNFKRLDLCDFDNVFSRLARHYNSQDSAPISVPKARLKALTAVAEKIQRFSSLELLSAEALGHVYENSVINKATRKLLGTHSTPPWLIDYIVGKLRPWIAEMPVEERIVFEPACGHAGFLVSALRLLDELRPDDFHEDRIPYLRNRLWGVDVDPFSQEVARLALTLADVPNPNGWKLTEADMFESDIIEQTCQRASIVLANPPFESFGKNKQAGWLSNKASETLSRVVHNLPVGGVIGFVGPQGILQNKQGKELRKMLLSEYEISEVTLFADKVFEYGEPESTVILARRLVKTKRPSSSPIRFLRVRENEVQDFARTQQASSVEETGVEALAATDQNLIFAPELQNVWSHLSSKFETIGSHAILGQGLFHKGVSDKTLPFGSIRESSEPFPDGVAGFASSDPDQMLHGLPQTVYLNLDPATIDRGVRGVETSIPQVVINYPPVSRGPWRLKGLIDEVGHPVTSDFLVARPLQDNFSLKLVWALCNSPLANAFAFCHLGKRHNLVGKMRELPIPNLDAVDTFPLEKAVSNYFAAAKRWMPIETETSPDLFTKASSKKRSSGAPTEVELRTLMLRVDAEVLKLYKLSADLERQVLDVFTGHERKGVPFTQVGYFPEGFTQLNTVQELLNVTADWDAYAKRKTDLIEKKVNKKASRAELAELKELKRLSAARRDLLTPLPLAELRELRDEITRQVGAQ